ncbi:trypsin-like [Schistocerca serialis cubense]|uniref:trypsin-like n=1 Tax=Schistocerca serialis cubense TaxID=2023355 RepID=UPI00214F1864|nr:trypsin-like [Schistocerca serialis cubense]
MAVTARVLLAIAVLCGLAVVEGWGRTHRLQVQAGRIVGGRNATIQEFPYQVSLQRKYAIGDGGSHFCGGSIIDARHVLTAGHCLYAYYDVLDQVIVSAGMTNVRDFDDPNLQTQAAEAAFIHDGFDNDKLTYDIGILRVAGSFNLDGTYVAAATLQNSTPPAGTICTITGWGYVEQDGYYVLPAILQAVDLPLILSDECAELYANYDDPDAEVRADNICAGLEEGGKDSCNGDSGGPMTCGGAVTGLVSWGDEVCGIPHYPGVYTDVATYSDWIADTLAASYAEISLKKLQQ